MKKEVRITLRIPEDLHQQLRKEAYKTGKSLQKIMIEAIAARAARKEGE